MDRALLLVGKIDNTETYQLLLGLDYLSFDYCGEMVRDEFYEEVACAFVSEMVKAKKSLKVVLHNGMIIDGGGRRMVEKLEDKHVDRFSGLVSRLVQETLPYSVPACASN